MVTGDGLRIERALLRPVEQCLRAEGCALLVGPAEVGKSYLAREVAGRFGERARYLDASITADRAMLGGDTGLVHNSAGQLIVIDEVHSFPDGLDLIRAELETARRDGRPIGQFLLLGSVMMDAERLVSERFGTRAQTFRLSPIGLAELPYEEKALSAEARALPSDVQQTVPITHSNAAIPMETLWLRGGFPQSLLAESEEASFAWRERYLESLCQRQYRHVHTSLSASTVREILSRVAATQGEPYQVDRSQGAEKACLDYLEDLGFIRRLRPWSPNELKRFEKRPKVYLRDSGLLHCLLNRRNHDQLNSDGTVLGHSWEGFCVENLVAAAPSARAFYYRSDEQDEVDLVLEFKGSRRIAIEIKSLTAKLGDGFGRAVAAIGPVDSFVVRPVPESSNAGKHRVMTLSDMMNAVRAAAH